MPHQKYELSLLQVYTVDRGKKFACYFRLEVDLKAPVYFVDVYSSWCIGSNENTSGLLGEFFLKKIDLVWINDEEINEALCSINHRPRKC